MNSFNPIAYVFLLLISIFGFVNSAPACRGPCAPGPGPNTYVCPPWANCVRGTSWVTSCIAPHKITGIPWGAPGYLNGVQLFCN